MNGDGAPESDELEAAFDGLLAAFAESAQLVKQHPFYGDRENRAGAYAYLTSMLLARVEEHVAYEPDQPYFRILDTRVREGGDNPDQRYSISKLRGGETYRIWGRLGAARRLDLQLYAGDPYIPGSGGRAASFLTFEQLAVDAGGSFEVIASPEPRPGNWIENPPDATRVLVRQIYGDWTAEAPGEVHIDRVGHEGEPRPVLTEADMAQRLRTAAWDLTRHVQVWPDMVRNGYMERLEPNRLSPPIDPGSLGGVPGRWMCSGTFELDPDEALVIRTWPSSGNYQGIQLADLWFSSLEYANRQSSLTGEQAGISDDGSYWFVVSATDPGVANWLDTVGRRRGVILLRFDGATEPTFDEARHPTAMKVALSELGSLLPAGTPKVTADERRSVLAARRRHVQTRFGN